jgi:hypothetical protein
MMGGGGGGSHVAALVGCICCQAHGQPQHMASMRGVLTSLLRPVTGNKQSSFCSCWWPCTPFRQAACTLWRPPLLASGCKCWWVLSPGGCTWWSHHTHTHLVAEVGQVEDPEEVAGIGRVVQLPQRCALLDVLLRVAGHLPLQSTLHRCKRAGSGRACVVIVLGWHGQSVLGGGFPGSTLDDLPLQPPAACAAD